MRLASVLAIVARLKLRLSLRYYQRNWGNAVAMAVMFLVLLGAVVFGAVSLYFYVHEAGAGARDTAFWWIAWILALIWLTAPLTQFDTQISLDLNGMRLFPLSPTAFTATALLDSLLSPLGLFLAPLSIGLLAALTLNLAELPWLLLSVLLLAVALLALSQAVSLWTNHLLQSRRFADASIAVTIVLFLLIQSVNLAVQQRDLIQLPPWITDLVFTVGHLLRPILDWLIPGLAARGFAQAAQGDMVEAVWIYTALLAQTVGAVLLAGLAARQFYSGELEGGGTVKRQARSVARSTLSAGGSLLSALFQRERVYLLRDPLLKLLFIQSLFSMVFVSAMLVLNVQRFADPEYGFADFSRYFVLGAALFLGFIESGLLFNKLGYEGPLFTHVLLTPVDRQRVLQAKSLFYLTHFGTLNILLVTAIALALRAPLLYAVCGVLIVACNTTVVDLVGNYVSILYPFTYRRRGRRLRAVMAQPGCGYMVLYMVVFNVCNLAVAPGSIALIAGTVFGGIAGLACGALFYATLLWLAYKYALPHAAGLLVKREPELVALLTRSQQ